MNAPSRGEVWLVDLDSPRGREQTGQRPALVVSVNRLNRGPAGLVIVVPVTGRDRRVPSHVALEPADGGLHKRSFAMCENLRAVARERLLAGPYGTVPARVMDEVADRMRLLLGL